MPSWSNETWRLKERKKGGNDSKATQELYELRPLVQDPMHNPPMQKPMFTTSLGHLPSVKYTVCHLVRQDNALFVLESFLPEDQNEENFNDSFIQKGHSYGDTLSQFYTVKYL